MLDNAVYLTGIPRNIVYFDHSTCCFELETEAENKKITIPIWIIDKDLIEKARFSFISGKKVSITGYLKKNKAMFMLVIAEKIKWYSKGVKM